MNKPTSSPTWHGIYVAAVTPLTATGAIDLDALPLLLDFFSAQGAHGALLFGTTGEGPSFTVAERLAAIERAAAYRAGHPDLRILVGVGMPALADAIELTRATFAAGLDGVLCLPPYFFNNASPAGLADAFSHIIAAAVPDSGGFFLYNIPQVAGVGVPFETIHTLVGRFPQQVTGIKDSTGDLSHTTRLITTFPKLRVFPGHPLIMAPTLPSGAAGSITALANVFAPGLRAVYDAFLQGEPVDAHQARVIAAHQALAATPGIATLKAALHQQFGFPHWPVRPPLETIAGPAGLPLTQFLATAGGE